LSYKWQIKTNEARKDSSSKGLGEFEMDDSRYAYLYINMPKIVEKIANTSDMLPPFSDLELPVAK
jgi:hypothetical protein